MSQLKKIQGELWRADMYQLLALSLDQPVGPNLKNLAGLLGDLASVAQDRVFAAQLGRLYHALTLQAEELLSDYQQLFVTKSACPVSEGSYHLAERGPVLGDVTAFYEAFKIKFHAESGPPDSMKMELGFMHFMVLKKVYALENKLASEFEITEDAEKKFLGDHLGRWVGPFTNKLVALAEHPFYQSLGLVLQEWVQRECERFQVNPVPLPKSLEAGENENCLRCAL